jgi:hypothetical protein
LPISSKGDGGLDVPYPYNRLDVMEIIAIAGAVIERHDKHPRR